jgi:hypothetical protein
LIWCQGILTGTFVDEVICSQMRCSWQLRM